MNGKIAGHTFVDGPSGRECVDCGKRWLAIVADREFWQVGQPNIAQVGGLTATEVGELKAEEDRIWDLTKEAARA